MCNRHRGFLHRRRHHGHHHHHSHHHKGRFGFKNNEGVVNNHHGCNFKTPVEQRHERLDDLPRHHHHRHHGDHHECRFKEGRHRFLPHRGLESFCKRSFRDFGKHHHHHRERSSCHHNEEHRPIRSNSC